MPCSTPSSTTRIARVRTASADADGRLWAIDHGVSFHADPKLRTVLWGWAGDPLVDGDLARLERLLDALDDAASGLTGTLEALLPDTETSLLSASGSSACCAGAAIPGRAGLARRALAPALTSSSSSAASTWAARGLPQAPDRVCRVKSWPAAFVPQVPGRSPQVRVRDTVTGQLVRAARRRSASVYVCGITPYDATHLGHAATYVTFDLLVRALRDSPVTVRYVQNITDIDDPLLERAERDGIAWEELATREIDLFREDMTALAVLPPDEYLGAVESIPTFIEPIEKLLDAWRRLPRAGLGRLRAEAHDVYFDIDRDPQFGSVSQLDEDGMLEVFAERGGDPDRPRASATASTLSCGARTEEGEPSWDGGRLGPGRPGWHIECACIACARSGSPSTSRGRHGPHLPAPRDERRTCPGLQRHPDVRPGLRPPGHGRTRRREDEQEQGQPRLRLRAAAPRRRPHGDPAGPARPTPCRGLVLGGQRPHERAATPGHVALGRLGQRRSAAEETPVVEAALADDLDSPRALAAVDRWAKAASTTAATTSARPACWPASRRLSASASEDSATPEHRAAHDACYRGGLADARCVVVGSAGEAGWALTAGVSSAAYG